ncbi:YciI family protein [Kribbella sp. CA-245084]|uniref:YciI family protein n=1 Tax=Kribbella sp. CA-245084 TaxID=3239940 RepID=UPI003D8E93DC
MPEYLIYFNQQWVGDHTEEWFASRGPLARAVVEDMKTAGVYVFAGGLEEDDVPLFSADPTSGDVLITDGPYLESKEYLGGFALVDVPDDETAKMWAAKVAEGCGWPQEVRRFKPQRK